MKYLFLSSLAILAFAFSGCDNPADDTPDAEVSDPVESEAALTGTEESAVVTEPKAPPAPETEAVKYVFTDESNIGFIGSKITGSHDGGFKEFTGYFFIQGDKPTDGDHVVEIDMSSTWADDEKLEGHLKSEDFFHVEVHPKTTFKVTSIDEQADGTYMIAGNLDLHGVSKNIRFPATVERQDGKIHIDAAFDINRFDFEIVYPGKSDDLIRKEVVIKLNLVAVPEDQA